MQFAALWDLDGVLADSGPFHFQSWAETLARCGVVFTEAQFRQTFGMNNTGILKLFLGPHTPQARIDEVGDEKEQIFKELIVGKLQALDGAKELLEALRAAGIPQAIGSSAPQANIDAEIDAVGVRPYFSAIISGAKMPGKPHPMVYLTAAAALGVPPERCVVFEDAIAGVQAAKAAGMCCIAVTSTNPAAALTVADRVVESLRTISVEMVRELVNHP